VSKGKDKDRTAARLDRIEAKLDEVLAFRTWLESRVTALTGNAGGTLDGITGLVVSQFLKRQQNGAKTDA
jgi:hypothetical protein